MTAGKLRANSIYTLRYNGTDFILQGEGGGGTALAGDVLTGKTATVDGGDITGTMPNNGAVTITPSASQQAIPTGYHNGSGNVPAVSVDATKVLTGTTIAGTAGSMPNQGALSYTPSPSQQTTGAGYHSSVTVSGVSVPAANVLTGTTIAGTAGTMPNNGSPVFTPTAGGGSWGAGYFGGFTVNGDANLVASNIKNGVSMFGVVGNLSPRLFAAGTVSSGGVTTTFTNNAGGSVSSYFINVQGLSFTANTVYAWEGNGSGMLCDTGVNFLSVSSIVNWNNGSAPTFYKVGTGNALVNGAGFQLPVPKASTSYSWVAFG